MRWFRRGAREPAARTVDAAARQALLAVLDRDLAQAEALLSRAVQLDSEAVGLYLALARVYRQRGEIGRAIHVHQNLLLRPDLPPADRRHTLAELAADFRQGGFLRRAIAAYEDVAAEDPRNPKVLEALGRLYRDARNPAGALEMERRLGRVRRRSSRATEAALWVEIADAARSEGRTAEARRALKRALRQAPELVAGWIALGDLEAERGRTRAALSAWRRVPGLDRRAARKVYPRLASAFAADGRAREYETFLRQRIEAEPEDTGARLALALALAARGGSDEAVREARAAVERTPEDLEAHALLGRMLLSQGREGEALKEYASFLEVLERQELLAPRESSG